MFKLTIETEDTQAATDLQMAFDQAMETTNVTAFMTTLILCLAENHPDIQVGRGGNHIWIATDGSARSALVSGKFRIGLPGE